jgi:hypothetical protein
MELPPISIEQKNIIEKIKNDKNIIVNSVAGSGKTTTNLYLAINNLNSKILLLTYNSKLKIETREKVKKLCLENLEVHSYHSFCVKYYDPKCFTDTNIKNILTLSKKKKINFNFDIIILDEAQDITNIYYELVCKIYYDNNKKAKICLLGDMYQSIYDFNDADERYIKYANILFNFNDYLWEKCDLLTTFRCSDKICNFVNNCLLNDNRLIPFIISNFKPRYLICNTFPPFINNIYDEDENIYDEEYYFECYTPYREFIQIINMGYKAKDIFILAPSIKTVNSPVRCFENTIKKLNKNISIYVPSSDEEKIDETVIENKLVFSTFHQAKGLERKVVFIFGFDNSYFKYYKKNNNTSKCPNEIYVACTRSIEQLILFHNEENDYLPFLKTKNLKNNVEMFAILNSKKRSKETNKIKKTNKIKNFDTTVTQLLRHLPEHVIDGCCNFLTINNIRNKQKKINIPEIIGTCNNNDNYMESVSEINGIAIPSILEYYKKNTSAIYEFCNDFENIYKENKNFYNPTIFEFWKEHEKKLLEIKKNNSFKENFLYYATLYNSLRSGYIFKSEQITNYDWMSNDIIEKCINNLESLNISLNSSFEEGLILENRCELQNRKLFGFCDCIDNDNNIVYEFKCTTEIKKEHYVQLAIYMYLHKTNLLLKKDIISEIKIDDNILFKYKNNICQGFIKKIHKVKINILDTNKKLICIDKQQIIKNISYENEKNKKFNSFKYYIYNILTNQLDEIKCELNELVKMIEYLIDKKYFNYKKNTDNEFIAYNQNIKNKYINIL